MRVCGHTVRACAAAGVLVLAVWAWAQVDAPPPAAAHSTTAPAATQPVHMGRLAHRAIAECSGIVASRRHKGVYWVHNDSGNLAALYAVDITGKLLGEYAVAAINTDWEDIAIDDGGKLYIADIGNNSRQRREVSVLRVAEPDPKQGPRGRLAVERSYRLAYPAEPFDTEALLLLGDTGYIIEKDLRLRAPGIYAFSLKAEGAQELKLVTRLSRGAPVTAADTTGDGAWLLVGSVAGLSLYRIDGDVKRAATQMPQFFAHAHLMLEAVCFSPRGLLLATEERDIWLFALPADALKVDQREK